MDSQLDREEALRRQFVRETRIGVTLIVIAFAGLMWTAYAKLSGQFRREFDLSAEWPVSTEMIAREKAAEVREEALRAATVSMLDNVSTNPGDTSATQPPPMPTASEKSSFPNLMPLPESPESSAESPPSTSLPPPADRSLIQYASSNSVSDPMPATNTPLSETKNQPPQIFSTNSPAMPPPTQSFAPNRASTEPPKKFELTDQFPLLPEPVEPKQRNPMDGGQMKLHPPAETKSASAEDLASGFESSDTVVAWTEDSSLWTIAQEHYGDGRLFRAVAAYNRWTDDDAESDRGLTEIRLPSLERLRSEFPALIPGEPSSESSDRDVENLSGTYITRPGDTLFSIARDELGQASRYVELIERNRSALPEGVQSGTRLPGGIRLMLEQE